MDFEFGNIVLYEGNNFESKILNPFTGKYSHCAIQTAENIAHGINLFGEVVHDLKEPIASYNSYVVVRHKHITQDQRNELKKLHNETSNDYDFSLILRLMFRKLRKKTPDLENLSTPGKFTCSSRIGHMYREVGLELGGINSSQMEPHDFLNKYFEEIRKWERDV